MWRGGKAGLVYFAIVFAVGFLLGTLRVLVVAPKLGEPSAVLIELPVVLVISWIACGWTIIRFAVPGALAPRLMMGGTAFAALMAAEMGVSVIAFGRTAVQHFETYRAASAVLGLMAQIAFALIPVVRLFMGPVDPGRE
jgi:hypothetical protein